MLPVDLGVDRCHLGVTHTDKKVYRRHANYYSRGEPEYAEARSICRGSCT
jgi:hypothetical protein